MSYKDKLIKTSDKIRNDLNTKLHGKTYTFNLPAFQGFGGGSFGGAGSGANWNYPNNYVELPQYERRTPIITQESFSQAFNRARVNGDPTFEFNGKTYTTEISDNPQYIGKRYQDKTSAVLREVLDDKMKVMSDSTRVEPFIGQPLGIRKRDESEYKYLDGGILFGKSGIHIKKKNRGSFIRWCKGKVTEECIARGKRSKNPKIRKKATFAANVRKFKHDNGGILKAQEGTGNLWTPQPLSPIGIALNQAKAVAKMKGKQQHLPSGVKEVVGPDGKKVAIRTEQPLVPLEQGLAEWLPGTGDVAEVGYIANDVKNGNYGSAALATAMIALPGNVNKLISKSRVDPLFINGKMNQAGIQEGLFGGKRSAESFMGSQTYKDAIVHDRLLAKRAFGYDINPVVDDRYIKMPVKIEGASLGPHDAGIMYPNPNTNNPADDIIKVDVGKHKTVNDLAATVFHEDLHHGRFKTIDPQGNTIFTEIYHPEKVNPTLDFYRWKLKHLFKPEIEIPQELLDHYKYLTSVEIPHNEGATNVLELGFLGNARAKNGYPGAKEVQRILDEVRKANPQYAYTIDLLNMKKPKRVWEAMTGQYESGGKITDDDYRERIKKFLLWKTVGPEEFNYIKNYKI